MGGKLSILIILLSLTIFSCTERIDIKLDNSYTRLVVEASVTSDTIKQKVILSMTSDYFYNNSPVMVTGADVMISDGSESIVLTEDQPGIYCSESDFAGVAGKTYTLNITLEAPIGGFRDYAASSTIHPAPQLDSIGLEFMPENWGISGITGIWELKSYFLDPPTEDYYRILVSKNSSMITDTLYEWYVTDDLFFNGCYCDGLPIGYLFQGYRDHTLSEGDTITVEIDGIEKGYAGFIREAQTEIYGSNPMFGGPSANIKGNINNGAIGFFAAYSVTRASAIIPAK